MAKGTTSKPRLYRFTPCALDVWDARDNQPAPGTIVRKIQPHGCPRNGTMAHCYVEPADGSGHYALVCEASLKDPKA